MGRAYDCTLLLTALAATLSAGVWACSLNPQPLPPLEPDSGTQNGTIPPKPRADAGQHDAVAAQMGDATGGSGGDAGDGYDAGPDAPGDDGSIDAPADDAPADDASSDAPTTDGGMMNGDGGMD